MGLLHWITRRLGLDDGRRSPRSLSQRDSLDRPSTIVSLGASDREWSNLPPEIRDEVQRLEREIGGDAVVKGWSISRKVVSRTKRIDDAGSLIDPEGTVDLLAIDPDAQVEVSQEFTYCGPDGREHRFASIEEMPPHVRAIFEKMHRSDG